MTKDEMIQEAREARACTESLSDWKLKLLQMAESRRDQRTTQLFGAVHDRPDIKSSARTVKPARKPAR